LILEENLSKTSEYKLHQVGPKDNGASSDESQIIIAAKKIRLRSIDAAVVNLMKSSVVLRACFEG
jgi:hypothetical protein